MVFGDSLSAGYGLPQGKAGSTCCSSACGTNYPYAVVNASISGEATLGGTTASRPLWRSTIPAL
jgi:hypothetical protein